MINNLIDELSYLQERMHRKSKKNFREYLKTKAQKYNLSYNIFPKSFSTKNVVIGNLGKAKYILGAHYDTPPRMPALLMKSVLFFNIITLILVIAVFATFALLGIHPIFGTIFYIILLFYLLGFGIANKYNFNDNTSGILTLLALMDNIKSDDVAYVFFDNEEKGLLGSIQFAFALKKIHQYQLNNKVFINFDCVGRGNTFGIISFKNKNTAHHLLHLSEKIEKHNISFEERRPSTLEASDHFSFKNWNSLGIMCYNKKGNKYRLNDIHSHLDKTINQENINVLVCLLKKHIDKEVCKIE